VEGEVDVLGLELLEGCSVVDWTGVGVIDGEEEVNGVAEVEGKIHQLVG